MTRARAVLFLVATALAIAAPASGFFKPKSVSGNMDSDADLERVQAVKLPDPSDPNNNDLAQTAVDLLDTCPAGPTDQRIAGPEEGLVTLRLVDADTRRGKDAVIDMRSGASGRFGELRVVALRRAPAGSAVCAVAHDDFRYRSTHPTRHPRGTNALSDFELSVRNFNRHFKGRELRLLEGWAKPSDALCCPSFEKTTFYRYNRARDRYVRYASKVKRVRRR